MFNRLPGMMIALLVGLAPLAASAQTTSTRVSKAEVVTRDLFPEGNVSGRVHSGNIATCQKMVSENIEIRFKWTLNTAYTDGDLRYALKVQRPGQSCATGSADLENSEDCTVIRANERIGTGKEFTFDIPSRTLLGFSDPATCEGRNESYDVIFVLPFVQPAGSTDSKTHEPDVLRIRMETTRPGAPGAVTTQGGESSIYVEWDEPSDAKGYYVYLTTGTLNEGDVPEDIQGASRHIVSSGRSLRITSGIQANQVYTVGVTAMDKIGNESLVSPTATVTTEPTTDFWEEYLNNGGRERGGYCQSASLTNSALLALLVGMLLLWRRSTAREEGIGA